MTIALLTDIHSNREALEACLAHAQEHGATQYVFLGDYVGYGADPAWVVETVMGFVQRGATALRGNHDEAAAGADDVRLNADARQCIDWTRKVLSPTQLEFLRELPLTAQDGVCLYVHANGWDPKNFEYILGPMQAARHLQVVRARITFCGHMHEPMLYHMGLTQRVETFSPVPGTPIPLSAARRWLALPGSVGQPRDGNPAACYAIFDELTDMLCFWRVPYDNQSAARKVRAAGLPPRYAQQLLHGA
ncbi:MAG TPA: metallophosphoesterase family protein [Burkholderiaceae bacterium]|nr:metallophosphoesterase family protein [Burkholderiaceae bacterium]